MDIQRLRQRQGLSIIELLIGVVFVVVGVLGITLALSKSMYSARGDQLHWIAVGIASSKIQAIKLLPIQNIYTANPPELTAAGAWFTGGAAANPAVGCDCRTVDWAQVTPIPVHFGTPSANFPYSEIITMNGVAFTCKVCINRFEGQIGATAPGDLEPYCPPGGGIPITQHQNQYAFVHVQVTWTSPQGTPGSTEAETLIGMQL